jgi:hypothetical protein
MSDIGGPEAYTPDEGVRGAPEELSEEAKARFAAAAAAMQAIRREEKRSKKRDTRVARTIIQFLGDERYTHLFVLISRLVARDCPSIFILSVLSLINDDCLTVVNEYLAEAGMGAPDISPDSVQLTKTGELDRKANKMLIEWIVRMQMVLAREPENILMRLMVDEQNIDGTVLQLTTFVLQEFFRSDAGGERDIPFEKLHTLTASILQTVFEPFLDRMERSRFPASEQTGADEDAED